MANPIEVAEVVALISSAYPNFNATKETVGVYYETLQDLPVDLLRAAVLQCVAEDGRKFAPSIGEIRGAATEIRKTMAGVPSSYQAWEEVRMQMVDVGSYGSPTFTHPLIEKAVKSLGWRNLCMSEDQVSDRARFISAYEQFTDRASKDDMRLPQVKAYIEANGSKALPGPGEAMKQLTTKLER